MAEHIPFLLIVFITGICLTQSSACELVPSFDGSCFELSANPYITTATSQFGPTIEGASVNQEGYMFAVNYGNSETIHQLGQFSPQQRLFYSDVNRESMFNGIRFLNSETAFIADTTNHRVLKLNVGSGNVVASSENYCSDANMIQPNDLTLSKTGTVYTSGMLWIDDTNETHGDIWSCLPDGTTQRLEVMGRTNGIELTPDEQHLYVSESYNSGGTPTVQRIWKYSSNVTDGTIGMRTLFADFETIDNTASFDIDGMKTDIEGNLFVARYGGRHVAIFSSEIELIGKISLNFPNPTNLEFGGPNGKTLFIVGRCDQPNDQPGKGCVDYIEVATPGRSWSMLQASSFRSMHQINNYSKSILLILILLCWTLRN